MFSDPLVVTYNTVAQNLALVERLGKRGVYQTADELFIATIQHQVQRNQRIRSVFRLDMNAVVSDPLDTDHDQDTISIQSVLERPLRGFTVTDATRLKNAHLGFLTDANFAKFFGQES